MKNLAFITALLLLSAAADARETARVLPKGISRARVVGVVSGDVNRTFNNNGDVELITGSMNRSVTINDLANAADKATGEQLKVLVQNLNALAPGAGDALAGANLNSKFATQARIFLAAYERGISNQVSIGVRLPIVTRTVTNRFSVNSVNNASAIRASVGALSPELSAGLDTFSQKSFDTAFFENSLFTSKGYEAPHDFSSTDPGDLEFGAKYNFYKTDRWISTVLLGARAPTGKKASLTNKFDKGTSKECWGTAVQYLEELNVGRMVFGGAGKYTYNFPDTRARAVPKDGSDAVPSLLPEAGQVVDVTRKSGNLLETELSALYRFKGDALGVWSAWQYADKATDSFKGPDNGLFYDGLAAGTGWNQHSGEVGIEYSTIPAFRQKKFSVPLEVSLLYNTPFAGKNSVVTSFTRLDLMVYF